MAHYAFLNDENIVTEVIAGIEETELVDGLSPEIWYGNFRGQVCKRTSRSNQIRGTYAGVGYSYNADEDIFITPQPYPSWTRTGSFWNPPTPMPTDGKMYSWVEDALAWEEMK